MTDDHSGRNPSDESGRPATDEDRRRRYGRVGDDPAVYVRPFGFVGDHAVVRRIGSRELFLGNRHAAKPDSDSREFAHVLTLSSDAYPLTTHHRPLVDGPDNDGSAFAAAVDCARRLHERPGATLVHCKAGISRSSAVTAATIAVAEDRPFLDALHEVQDARPHAVPNPALHQQGVVYVQAHR